MTFAMQYISLIFHFLPISLRFAPKRNKTFLFYLYILPLSSKIEHPCHKDDFKLSDIAGPLWLHSLHDDCGSTICFSIFSQPHLGLLHHLSGITGRSLGLRSSHISFLGSFSCASSQTRGIKCAMNPRRWNTLEAIALLTSLDTAVR
jgi:hypothetical protein